MAFSQPSKVSPHSSPKLKKKKHCISKRPRKAVCNIKKEEEENTKGFVQCKQIVDATAHSRSVLFDNSLAMTRAHEVQNNLDQNFPAFVKLMLRSHVTGGFWLGLPRPFCVKNLPEQDDTVVLIGENGKEYNTKYLAGKNGLSGGWRGFSIAHNLLEGDALVFQLVEKWKFKVFILRASGLTEVDGAIGLLNLHVEVKPIVGEPMCEALMQASAEPPGSCSDKECSQGNNATMLVDNPKLLLDQFESESYENFGSDISGEIRFLESVPDFEDVKSFNAFNIVIDGLTIDSEVNEHIRKKYYELCCSQKCYLHGNILAGLNFKLVAGMISETVNVADAIRSAKFVTPVDYLETWDKTLKCFEDLGMAVRFLRERLKKLGHISQEQKKKFETVTLERTSLEEETRNLKSKLLDAEMALRHLDDEIEAMKVEGKRVELNFNEVASAPW